MTGDAAEPAAARQRLFQIREEWGPFADLLQDQMPHPLQRAIMPVVVTRAGVPRIEGTAFAIGAGIALTAAHVMSGPQPEDVRLLYIEGTNEDDSLRGLPLPLYGWGKNDKTDVAVLQIRLPEIDGEQLVHGAVPISFIPPVLGSAALAIGYTAGFEFEPGDADDPGTFSFSPRMNASQGTVQDVHLNGRDPVMIPFPAFQVDARFDHQMSGSPILAAAAPGLVRVVGLVSTSMDTEDGVPVSHGSLLWPAASLRLAFHHEGGVRFQVSLLDLAQQGVLDIEGTEHVEVEPAGGTAWTVHFRM